MECEDCNVESEDVSSHYFDEERDANYKLLKASERIDLCEKCYKKRTDEDSDEEENDSTESQSVSSELGEIDLSTPEKCRELIERIKALQAAGQIESDLATTLIQTINNSLEAHRLQEKK